MDPQQELFTGLLLALKAHFEPTGYAVYDGGLPPAGAAYPFVYLANSQQIDTETKAGALGSVTQYIHVYHNNPKRRGSVSQMLLDAKMICRKFTKSENFAWFVQNVDQEILPDNTTATPLLHGVLVVTFKFS